MKDAKTITKQNEDLETRCQDTVGHQRVLPKLCGADIELGNFILGLETSRGTGFEASRLLLGEIDGLPRADKFRGEPCDCQACTRARESASDSRRKKSRANGGGQTLVVNPQDWGRKYLPTNGGCIYIDLDHLELCLPEVLSAYDHVACWHSMLKIARRALTAANQKLPERNRIQVLVNNSDGQSNSYGSHLNFLISRRAWDNIFRRKIHYMLYLAAFQASSIVCTGQGKVGSENGTPDVAFQISQRADFFERLVGSQTTHNRPIVNSRDEALCGGLRTGVADEMARLHVIFFDNTLCHVASLLKVGVMQIVLAMIEAEAVNVNLLLDDPVEAVLRWSHDPTLEARARLTTGEEVTAVELQMMFLEAAKDFVRRGACEGVVPRAEEIVSLWEDTLLKLQAHDFASLATRLDWVLKLSILEQVLDERRDLSWESPEIKHLDHLYSSLDDSEGLYWAYDRGGFVQRVASDDLIARFEVDPPEDTRAWTRAMLLRRAGAADVDDVDWDSIRFKVGYERYRTKYRRFNMPSPLGFSKADSERHFESASDLGELIDALEGDAGESESLQLAARNQSKLATH
jgi:proteasome accessory factor A